jgi:uncharacterized integral membrane protein
VPQACGDRYARCVAQVPQRGEQEGLGQIDEGVDKRQVARLAGAGVLLLGAVAFIVQNNDKVETTFLFFTVEASLWVSLLVALVLGVVIGMSLPVIRRHWGEKD